MGTLRLYKNFQSYNNLLQMKHTSAFWERQFSTRIHHTGNQFVILKLIATAVKSTIKYQKLNKNLHWEQNPSWNNTKIIWKVIL